MLRAVFLGCIDPIRQCDLGDQDDQTWPHKKASQSQCHNLCLYRLIKDTLV